MGRRINAGDKIKITPENYAYFSFECNNRNYKILR